MNLNNPFDILSVKFLGVGVVVDYSVTGPKAKPQQQTRSIGLTIEIAVWSKSWQSHF